jgi:hypothetical protein
LLNPDLTPPVIIINRPEGKEIAAMSAISAWPFLFGRGRTVDYRPILVPAFLVEKNGRNLLSIIGKDAEITELGHAALRRIDSERLGPLLVVFRVIRPRKEDVARSWNQRDDFLVDQFGRPLTLVAGVIIQNEYTLDIASAASLLNAAGAVLVPAFQEFWAKDDEASPPKGSESLLFDIASLAVAPETPTQSSGEARNGLKPRLVTQLDQLPPLNWEPSDRPYIQAPSAPPRHIDLSEDPWLPTPGNEPRSTKRMAIFIAVVIIIVVGVAAVIYAMV